MMKIDTINVVEYNDDDLLSITSFSNNPEGNKEAEKCFSDCVKNQGVDDNDIASYVNDRYYEQGTYQIFLYYSN